MARHVAHLAVESGAQPVEKMRLVGGRSMWATPSRVNPSSAAPALADQPTARRDQGRRRVVRRRSRGALRIMAKTPPCAPWTAMSPVSMHFNLADSSATEALGAALARAFRAARTAAGAVVVPARRTRRGKTTCVRSLLRALGVTGAGAQPDLHPGRDLQPRRRSPASMSICIACRSLQRSR